MYKSKKDVDKLAESLQLKLSEKEFQTRAYSVAYKYYEVGDYVSCQKYVEQYLKHKDNNAAAYKLLGQTLHKIGQKEQALEQYKVSLEIDPGQTSTILDICEILADDEVIIDPGRAKLWCEKAEATFPRHPVTFKLRERLITTSNPDPKAVVSLIISELAMRPKDVSLHTRLLNHYLNNNFVKEAFDHACNMEFGDNTFVNNFAWYNILSKLLNNYTHNTIDWLYQLLLLTVRERICVLSITETPSGSSQSLCESNELLHAYDQAIYSVTKLGAPPGHAEFYTALLQHHRGQIAFHAATLLLKKAKKDQLSWREATTFSAPLMLSAWQTIPLDSKVNWLKSAPVKQVSAVNRWYSEGTFRCSQAGHYLLSVIQDKNQSFLDQVSQCCSATHWRDKFYKKIFSSKGHLDKMKTSYIASDVFSAPIFRIPRKSEVEAYDVDAQREYVNSIHHFVWILLHYENFARFKCTLFDMLDSAATTCAPETLNRLDILAFLYCATLSARQQKPKTCYMTSDKPNVLPANITDLLCSFSQMKWWDCAYKFSQNLLGTELTDIRATLSRGIEVVRCLDNHGLDPELLCILGRIFSEQAKLATDVDIKGQLDERAGLYYRSAIPLLEKLKSKIVEKIFGKRLFSYTHKELGTKELNTLIEECKLYVAGTYLNNGEYERVIEITANLKSPLAYYHLAQTYKKMAVEEINLCRNIETHSKFAVLLSKAKTFAFNALDRFRDTETNKNNDLYSNIQELIAEIETLINKIEPDLFAVTNDGDGKYSSDENLSGDSEYMPARNIRGFRNISSTPKATPNANSTKYRTAMDTQISDNTRMDQSHLNKIDNEIKKLQKKDSNINEFMDQTKSWFEENRKLGNEIISTIQTNMQNTTDQFKLLKISVDQVKGEIDECRNEYKGVGELKKDIAELKKEVNKLKKASAEQVIDDTDLYNLEDEYRTSDNSSSTYANRLPFSSAPVLPPFNQRLVPPFTVPHNTYQLYNQSLMNLYNQYSQFAQPSSVPGAQSMFDPTRSQVNYSGVYPTPDQIYIDGAHLVPAVPTVPPVVANTLPKVPTMAAGSVPPPATSVATSMRSSVDTKEATPSLPVNVVITSSDPLPTCTTTPVLAYSVTIPPKHIKGTPHNYQIAMPSTNETNVASPPVFVFPQNKPMTSTGTGTFANWNHSSIFKTTSANGTSTMQSLLQDPLLSVPKISADTLDTSRSVVDGMFGISTLNTSLNKSRTISEKSNTSIENYDPCPDFKPIVPLPAEVKVTTGEEDEIMIFNSRAKLFRFAEKQWKERGIGEMKLLQHKATGKVRVLMRREQVHKICANHIITADMEIKPMKNETKAYFWVANDFADETVVLEKFCIRFKTADIALDFYNSFENARLASSNLAVSKSDQLKLETPKFSLDQTVQSVATSHGKSVFGGFTFSSTPTLKPVLDDEESGVKKPLEVVPNKMNVFSGLSFKSNTSAPVSNIFNVTPSVNISTPSSITQNMASNTSASGKLNSSDTVEEYEPNVDFKPVIPLPALIDQKTGEEDETILFEHRAKLLRFDAASKEWKERGLGNIKLLVHKDNIQKVRLLMRREQIMKVCCNHAITKDMIFQKMPNVNKAVTWCAKDFSEGELVAETLCLRFKTALLCDQFIEAVTASQAKMKDESKSAKEEQNAAKQTAQTGFGDKFKAKSGSWHCDTCYTNNLENFNKCACCETPKPKSTTEVRSVSFTPTNVTITVGWGDKFKPKVGSWECQSCLVRNEGTLESCTACNSPKDPTKPKTTATKQLDNTTKFNFGIPPTTATSTVAVKTESTAVNTGRDMFKPNPVENKKSIFDSAPTGTVQFRFGMPPTISEQKSNAEASIFDGTGAHKFSFGIPPTNYNNSEVSTAFGEKPYDVFGTPNIAADNIPVDFTVKKTNEQITPAKPALLPTPQTYNQFTISEDGKFNYVFKPKMGKSPIKSPLKDRDDESDDNEYVAEDECHHSFTPVIPLPDKVEVVTGEENEIELYGHIAKLYRFISSEWKERGKGIVKILKHKETGKLRVVMRRDQVLKICLNHSLSPDVNYTSKDEKSWLFVVNDFSEGELTLEHFCLRFKNKEIASKFKEAVDRALQGGSFDTVNAELTKDDSDDVIFVNEIQATDEEKQKASELMLPENFFTYKNKEPCQGCRGCQDDDAKSTTSILFKTLTTPQTSGSNSSSEAKPASTAGALKASFTLTTNASTPLKVNTPLFQSPANSIYGTPTSSDKTVDTSIFRTPLGAIGYNSKTPLPATAQTIFGNNVTNKENTFSQKSNLFSGFNEENADNVTSQSNPSIFANSNTSVGTKGSVLAPPKLNTVNPSSVNPLNNISFGSSKSKSVFSDNPLMSTTNIGISSNKSIFDNKTDSQNTEVKSIFGDYGKSENLFTSVNQGSIFGPGALANNQPKLGGNIFGSGALGGVPGIGPISSQKQTFEAGSSLFGTSTPASAIIVASNSEKPKEASSNNMFEDENAEKTGTILFSVDDSPSFAALSSISDAGFEQSKKNPDFKWEGAGEQLFVAKKQSAHDGDKSLNESGAGDEDVTGGDEEYDPQYAPIVPLPDKIVVTTGEEDEKKLFGERCKLYRYDDTNREWKERGIGEMKILYHPDRQTYRLLLRREQVHKAVLNMLLHMDLELLQMKNSDRAWTWAGRNFAENPAGEQETLAVRFKSVALAVAFQNEVIQCVKKLQEAAASAVEEDKEATDITPLRLPKHLQESARADNSMSSDMLQRTLSVPATAPTTLSFTGLAATAPSHTIATPVAAVFSTPTTNSEASYDAESSVTTEKGKKHQLEEEPDAYEDDEDEEDYDAYYNEDEEYVYHSCDAEAVIRQGDDEATCACAHIQVLFDQEISSPKILITDSATGQLLADMVIYTETEFRMTGDTCVWSGKDFTDNVPVDKTVTLNFFDSDTSMQFYDSCETSKAATYSSTDPES